MYCCEKLLFFRFHYAPIINYNALYAMIVFILQILSDKTSINLRNFWHSFHSNFGIHMFMLSIHSTILNQLKMQIMISKNIYNILMDSMNQNTGGDSFGKVSK